MNWTMAWITVRPTTLLGMFLMTLLTTHLTARIEALLMAQIMARAHDVDYSANKDIDDANDADNDNAIDGVNDSNDVVRFVGGVDPIPRRTDNKCFRVFS